VDNVDKSKQFELLSSIMRASHFEWRRAVIKLCPNIDPEELVRQYWSEVGKDTVKVYLRKIDPEKDLAMQVAELFVASSKAMGEDAETIGEMPSGGFGVRHNDCPWYHWHKRENLLEEDLIGCDHWLRTVVDGINAALSTSLQFETLESLPGGDSCCVRRFWEGDQDARCEQTR
jgi:hypothetical protein